MRTPADHEGCTSAPVQGWADVFDASVGQLRRLVRKRAPHADVDDIIQETFAQLLRRGTAIDTSEPMMPLLSRVARARAIDAWRARRHELILDLPDQQDDRSPGDALEAEIEAQVVHAALAQLRPRHRRLLIRWACQEAPLAQVADEEGVSTAAVKMALSRARRGFRETYERELGREGLLAVVPTLMLSFRRLRPRWARITPSTHHLGIDRLAVGAAGVAVVAVSACGIFASADGADAQPARFAATGLETGVSATSPSRPAPTIILGEPDQSPSPRPATTAPPRSEVTQLPAPNRAPRVETGVTVGDHSTATISTGWDDPAGRGHGEAAVSLQCTRGIVWSASCMAVQTIPVIPGAASK